MTDRLRVRLSSVAWVEFMWRDWGKLDGGMEGEHQLVHRLATASLSKSEATA
jgi:hypothetical protein